MPTKAKKNFSIPPAMLVSIAALVVSVCSAGISYYNYSQSGKYSEIGIRPLLLTSGSIFSKLEDGLFIQNVGKGEAFIDKISYYFGDKEVSSKDIVEGFEKYKIESKLIDGINNCSIEEFQYFPGVVLLKDQQFKFLPTKGICKFVDVKNFFINFNIDFEYSSYSKTKYNTKFVFFRK